MRKVPSTPEEGLSGLVVVSTKIDAMENRAPPVRAVFSSSGSVYRPRARAVLRQRDGCAALCVLIHTTATLDARWRQAVLLPLS